MRGAGLVVPAVGVLRERRRGCGRSAGAKRIAVRQRFDEVRRLLEAYGFELTRVRGSHHIFEAGGVTVIAPLRRPHVLPVYVKRVLQLTEEYDDGNGDD